MDRVHYFVLLLLVLYYPLRVKPGPVRDGGDVTSDVTTDTSDAFTAVDMINLFRSSNVPAKRKAQRTKAKKKLTSVPRRYDNDSTDDSTCSSGSDRSDHSGSDDAPDSHSDWDDDSPMYPSDLAYDSAGSGSDKCCGPSQYSDESE